MSERDRIIQKIIDVGMIRRDVATDIATAILQSWWVQPKPCPHTMGKIYPTEVGSARQCDACGAIEYFD